MKDFTYTIIEVEKLIDFIDRAREPKNKKDGIINGGGDHERNKEGDTSPNSSDAKVSKTEYLKKMDKKKKDKPFIKEKKKNLECFLYDGLHMVHNYLKRKILSAMKKTSSMNESKLGDSSKRVKEICISGVFNFLGQCQ